MLYDAHESVFWFMTVRCLDTYPSVKNLGPVLYDAHRSICCSGTGILLNVGGFDKSSFGSSPVSHVSPFTDSRCTSLGKCGM
jgi:hypothetical protein